MGQHDPGLTLRVGQGWTKIRNRSPGSRFSALLQGLGPGLHSIFLRPLECEAYFIYAAKGISPWPCPESM